MTASTSANTRTRTWATRKMPMLTRNPAKILGSVSANLLTLKNVDCTRGHPGELTTTQPTSAEHDERADGRDEHSDAA